MVDEYNQQSGLHIQLVTSDPTAFDSRMAHYGKFSGISNYLAMIGPKSDELLDEKIGYPAEQPQPKDKWLPENVSYNEYK